VEIGDDGNRGQQNSAIFNDLERPEVIYKLSFMRKYRCRVRQKMSRISTISGDKQGCILAPILFCVAIATDWIIQQMSFNPGINVGSTTFTDLVYAALLFPSATDATTSFKSFTYRTQHLLAKDKTTEHWFRL